MSSDVDAMLRLHNALCTTGTCCFTSRGKHPECGCPSAGICQGLSQNTWLFPGMLVKVLWFTSLGEDTYLHSSYNEPFIYSICQIALLLMTLNDLQSSF